jgi:hypothetical protein
VIAFFQGVGDAANAKCFFCGELERVFSSLERALRHHNSAPGFHAASDHDFRTGNGFNLTKLVSVRVKWDGKAESAAAEIFAFHGIKTAPVLALIRPVHPQQIKQDVADGTHVLLSNSDMFQRRPEDPSMAQSLAFFITKQVDVPVFVKEMAGGKDVIQILSAQQASSAPSNVFDPSSYEWTEPLFGTTLNYAMLARPVHMLDTCQWQGQLAFLVLVGFLFSAAPRFWLLLAHGLFALCFAGTVFHSTNVGSVPLRGEADAGAEDRQHQVVDASGMPASTLIESFFVVLLISAFAFTAFLLSQYPFGLIAHGSRIRNQSWAPNTITCLLMFFLFASLGAVLAQFIAHQGDAYFMSILEECSRLTRLIVHGRVPG